MDANSPGVKSISSMMARISKPERVMANDGWFAKEKKEGLSLCQRKGDVLRCLEMPLVNCD